MLLPFVIIFIIDYWLKYSEYKQRVSQNFTELTID